MRIVTTNLLQLLFVNWLKLGLWWCKESPIWIVYQVQHQATIWLAIAHSVEHLKTLCTK